MRTKEKFVDEVSGLEFDNEAEAIKSEKKHRSINEIFSFWKNHPEDRGCRFANGNWCYQRTEQEYNTLIDAIKIAVTKHEKWILKDYEKHGGLKRDYCVGGSILGRFLDDGGSPIYRWHLLAYCICPKCFREWGQPYYAINCGHNAEPRLLGGV